MGRGKLRRKFRVPISNHCARLSKQDYLSPCNYNFNTGSCLVFGDVDRGAVLERGGDLVHRVPLQRRLEQLRDVDDDRGRQAGDDVTASGKGGIYL